MARKLKSNKPTWIKFDEDPEIQFKIKPFWFLNLKVIPSGDISPQFMGDMFVSTVVEWKGIVGEDDKPLDCNPKNKQIVAEQNMDLVIFAFNKSFNDQDVDKKEDVEETKN